MNPKALGQRILNRLHLGMTDVVVQGEGYEALVMRNGIVVGRVYIGTLKEVESSR